MSDTCKLCGAWEGLHHFETMQCPRNGVEAPVGRKQEWQSTIYQRDDSDITVALTQRAEAAEARAVTLQAERDELARECEEQAARRISAEGDRSRLALECSELRGKLARLFDSENIRTYCDMVERMTKVGIPWDAVVTERREDMSELFKGYAQAEWKAIYAVRKSWRSPRYWLLHCRREAALERVVARQAREIDAQAIRIEELEARNDVQSRTAYDDGFTAGHEYAMSSEAG